MSRIPLATTLKTRTGAPSTKDARQVNSYIEIKGDQSAVRKRPAAQGGVPVGTGIAQGGYGLVLFYGDVPYVISPSTGTTWNSGSNYLVGDHVAIDFVDYWALNNNTNSQPPSGNWSRTYVPAVPSTFPTAWSAQSIGTSAGWYSMAYGNGIFFAGADTGDIIAYSNDGITWNTHTTGLSITWKVIYGNSLFMAFKLGSASGGVPNFTYATSTDLINWTIRSITSSTALTLGVGLVAGGGKTLVFSDSSAKYFYTSDGINWNETLMPAINAGIETWGCYGNGMFVIIYSQDVSYKSSDGINWTAGTLPTNAYWNSVAYGNGIFLAVSGYRNGGSINSTTAATSVDGVNWTQRTLPSSAQWKNVTFANGYFCVTGTNSIISCLTKDGITWITKSLPLAASWAACAGGSTTIAALQYNSTNGALLT